MPITEILLALTILLGSSVTTMNLDEAPEGWTNEYGQMVLQDGRVLNSALGCHGADDIRYYRRTPAQFLADQARNYPGKPFRDRVEDAHAAFVETEVHELLHAAHCQALGSVAVAPTAAQGRAIFEAAGLDGGDWQPRPATWGAAYRVLTTLDIGLWASVSYCWSNDAEWLACLGTATAKAGAR